MRDILAIASKPSGYGFIDLEGQRFGRLTVLGYAPTQLTGHRWLCWCDCGRISVHTVSNLRGKRSVSCGCTGMQSRAEKFTTHGQADSPEYKSYYHMRGRCLVKTNAAYPDYGGRGISVCARWLYGENGKTGFECFLADMGARPSTSHTLDRRNNDGNYEPTNCRWATDAQQARNRRANKYVTLNGEKLSLAEACERLNLNYGTVNSRMKRGATFERAVSK